MEADSYFDHLVVGWIPEGFQIVKVDYNHWTYYENQGGDWIQILISSEDSAIQIDTENAEVSNASINALPAVIVKKGEQVVILLTNTDKGLFYTVISHGVDCEITKKIAENLII